MAEWHINTNGFHGDEPPPQFLAGLVAYHCRHKGEDRTVCPGQQGCIAPLGSSRMPNYLSSMVSLCQTGLGCPSHEKLPGGRRRRQKLWFEGYDVSVGPVRTPRFRWKFRAVSYFPLPRHVSLEQEQDHYYKLLCSGQVDMCRYCWGRTCPRPRGVCVKGSLIPLAWALPQHLSERPRIARTTLQDCVRSRRK